MAESKDILQIGIETILLESKSLNKLSTLLDVNFSNVVHEILSSKGRVVVTGIGKSAIIGQKIAATFNSTGTPALFMHVVGRNQVSPLARSWSASKCSPRTITDHVLRRGIE